jgi:Uncharacterized conserved protein
MISFRRDFASGLITIIPIVVIVLVANSVYRRLVELPLIRQLPEPVGFFVAVTVLFFGIYAVGYFMRTAVGRVIESILDRWVDRLPGLRVLYKASKLAVETAVTGTDDLQRPVKVTLWGGMRMTAFKTGKTTADGRDVLFLPTAPNITSGYVIEVDPAEYESTGESVEDALTRILSAGFADDTPRDPVQIDVSETEA